MSSMKEELSRKLESYFYNHRQISVRSGRMQKSFQEVSAWIQKIHIGEHKK